MENPILVIGHAKEAKDISKSLILTILSLYIASSRERLVSSISLTIGILQIYVIQKGWYGIVCKKVRAKLSKTLYIVREKKNTQTI